MLLEPTATMACSRCPFSPLLVVVPGDDQRRSQRDPRQDNLKQLTNFGNRDHVPIFFPTGIGPP